MRTQWGRRVGAGWLGLGGLTIITLLLVGAFLHRELSITGGVLGVPLDDAWIHFQFARNLQQGAGFSYNPNEPTPGSTAPLWTILVALAAWPSGEFLSAGLALSVFFLLLTVWGVYGFTMSLTGKWWLAFVAGAGVIFTGRLLWAGLAAMETTAFAALTVLAVWAYSRVGLRPLPVLLFALAGQLRPEGHLLFSLAALDTVIATRWGDPSAKRVVRQLAVAILFYAVIAAPYILFSLSTTGHPLPNTFYAKVGSQHLISWRTLSETVIWHFEDNPIALVLALIGAGPLWRRSRLAVMWLVGLPLLTAFLIDTTWHHGRYTMPIIPFVLIAAAIGMDWLVARLSQSGTRRLSAAALAVLLLAAGLYGLPYWATQLGQNTREIEDIDVALGRWLADNTPEDALIAVDDIGAIAFLSGRRIVDLNGLVSPELWPAVRAPEGLLRAQVMTQILSVNPPDYLAVFPLWRWDIVTNPAISEQVHKVSTPTHTIIFQPEVGVYRIAWPYLPEAMPQSPAEVTFGESIRLLGFDHTIDGDELDLTLYWDSLVPTGTNYDVFVHVMDSTGQIIAQADREPAGGIAPTSLWQPGDIVRDTYQLVIPDLGARAWSLHVGLYLRESGERLPTNPPSPDNSAMILSFDF